MAPQSQINHLQEILALIDQAQKLAMEDDKSVLAFILQTASLEASERIEEATVVTVSKDNDEN